MRRTDNVHLPSTGGEHARRMSMSTPFDPQQPGADLPVDGIAHDDQTETEREVEEDRGADVGPDSVDPSTSPVPHEDEDEAGGGPVFRRPQAGDRLHADDLPGDGGTRAEDR